MSESVFTYIILPLSVCLFVGLVFHSLSSGIKEKSRNENLQRELACIESGRDFIHGQCRKLEEPNP